MVGPHCDHDMADSQQPPGHHDGRSASAGVSSGQPPSSTTTTSPLHQTGRSPMAVVTSLRMQCSLMLLEWEMHEIRLKIGQKEMEGKGTAKYYPCQVQNYRAWFEQEQSQIAANDPSRVMLPAFPVTAAKVTAFLHHESTREKVCPAWLAMSSARVTDLSSLAQLKRRSKSAMIEGSSLGKSHMAQVVNALENHQLNHEHEHPQDHETRTSLWKDACIHAFESASKHNEPSGIERSQAIKAAGTTSGGFTARGRHAALLTGCVSDTYTSEELLRCSLWALTEFSGRQQVFIGLRDRTMLLLSAVTAFRGESCRMLQWSDLFQTMAPLDQTTRVEVRRSLTGFHPKGEGLLTITHIILQVLAALADNAKHNQHGRVDEHSVIQHCQVELCAIGALAFMFFGHFHVLDCPPLKFAPDFANKQYGEYGHREWYSHHVFYAGSTMREMLYDSKPPAATWNLAVCRADASLLCLQTTTSASRSCTRKTMLTLRRRPMQAATTRL
jgi:hypothetical protein